MAQKDLMCVMLKWNDQHHISHCSHAPLCVTSAEPIVVEVVFRNPLKVPLALSELSLLWKFTLKDFSGPQGGKTGETVCNEKEAATSKVRKSKVVLALIISDYLGLLCLIHGACVCGCSDKYLCVNSSI